MTKSEYLSALKDKLESFNMELQQEIMEDYEQHFAEGLAAGKSEDEIIEELGSIEDMIQELPEEDMKQEIQAMDAVSRKNSTYEGEYKAIAIEGLVADVYLEGSDDGCISVDYQNDGDVYIQQKYRFYQYEENGVFHVGVKDSGERKDKKKIIVVNKIDLENKLDKSLLDNYIEISVKENIGINKIKEEIKRLFNIGEITSNDMTYLSNARSISLLKKSLNNINESIDEIKNSSPIDIVELNLKEAWNNLGEVIGETYTDELLDELFSRFCLGK